MNRTQLHSAIEALPVYETRDVYVQNTPTTDDVTKQITKAICEVGTTEAVAYCSPKYNLLQFKDVLTPVINGLDDDTELEGHITHYGGYASMAVFPKTPDYADTNIGLLARNSVDKSSSIVVKFCIRSGPHTIILPAKIAGLKKTHTRAAKNLVHDYAQFLGQVKDAWQTIVDVFPKAHIVDTTASQPDDDNTYVEWGSLFTSLNLGPRLQKYLKNKAANKAPYTVWDVFTDLLDRISHKQYKSGFHRERAVDTLCTNVYEYAVALKLTQ